MPSHVQPDQRVVRVHRVAALVIAAIIALFGVLGLIGGLGFFDTDGAPVLGLSTNGALSTVSVLTAVVLVASAIRGGRLASTVMIVIGALFIVSAFANLGVMGTSANLFAFRLPNVFFSIGAGLVLLLVGAYGRLSSKLPSNNPYRMERHPDEAEDDDPAVDTQPRPTTLAEVTADQDMAAASRAVASATATPDQRRRVEAMDRVRTQEERRAVWMGFENPDGEGRSDASAMA